MKKSNIISQIAFVWSLGLMSVAPVWAQTCIKTPSCADLGYTKTEADCAGKTILKCPLDTTKVYCPGAEESSRTYKFGDTYVDGNGIPVGKIVQVDSSGQHGTLISSGAVTGTQLDVGTLCISKTTGGLDWGIADARLVANVITSSNSGCMWVSNGFCSVSSGYVNFCNGGGDCSGKTSNSIMPAYCQAQF